MEETRLLVLDKPDTPHLRLLDRLTQPVKVDVGIEPAFLQSAAPHADVILLASSAAQPLRDAWPFARKVRWVHSLWAGVEDFLFSAFANSPVPLSNARGIYKRSLAEFVMTGVLYFAKDIPRMLRQQKAAHWEKFEVTEAHGHTLGVVGYGEIGRASAALAKSFGMRILAVRRNAGPGAGQPDGIADAVFAPDQLREMLAQCDYVVVAAPITPQTRGMIGEAELAVMKKSAVIINVGRGPVIAEAPLILALKEGRLLGAALDVFDEEPLPKAHPFWQMPNVLLSPHCADRTPGWLEMSTEFFIQNFDRFQKGQPLENIVDKKARY